MNRGIRIAICEDNHEYSSEIKAVVHSIFKQNDLTELKAEINIYHSGEELTTSQNQYDIILQDLDLGIGRMHGYEVAKVVNQKYNFAPIIIILTSNADQGEGSYEEGVKAASFVVKRADNSKLKEVLLKFIKKLIQTHGITVPVTSIGDKYFLVDEIRYIKKDAHETCIYTNDGLRFLTRTTIKEWLDILPKSQFAQLSKSVIVNFGYVRQITIAEQTAIIKNGFDLEVLKISRERFKVVNQQLLNYEKQKARGMI